MQIFIDFDGPVLDVIRRYYLIYSDLIKEADYLPFDQESYWSLKRLSIKESAIVQRNMPDAGVGAYLDRRNQLLEDPAYLVYDRLQKGALDTLERWSEQHRLYLITLRRNRSALISQLELLGIRDRFEEIFCAQGVEPGWKTKCEWIRTCRVHRDDALVIGDTEVDILAGRAAGVHTIAVSCGMRSRRLLEHLSPDAMASRLSDIDLYELFDNGNRYKASISAA